MLGWWMVAAAQDPVPDWRAGSGSAHALAGRDVAIGDLDGDGYDDVLVAAPYLDITYYYAEGTGSILGYAGGPGGPAAVPTWVFTVGDDPEGYGDDIALGDVDGDGFDDLAVGEMSFRGFVPDENVEGQWLQVKGRVTLFRGGNPPHTRHSWSALGAGLTYFGGAVAIGDLNGDGYAEIIVGDEGAGGHGAVYVFAGSPDGPDDVPVVLVPDPRCISYGTALSVGDLDSDGFGDLVVGSADYGEDDGRGCVTVHRGSPSGVETDASVVIEGDQTWSRLGFTVAVVGDVDADGFDDVLAGAPYYAGPEVDEGYVALFRGSAAGLSTVAAWTAEPDVAGVQFGRAVGPAGDTDGDGFDDVLVSGVWTDGARFEGHVLRYGGQAGGLAGVPSWTWDANREAVVDDIATGDVNGDGLDDAVLGSPTFRLTADDEGAAFAYLGCIPVTFWEDVDGDGLGDPASSTLSCDAPDGWVSIAGDPCPADAANDSDGDGVCDADDDCIGTCAPPTTEVPPVDAPDPAAEPAGCGCGTTGGMGGWLLAAMLLVRRTRGRSAAHLP